MAIDAGTQNDTKLRIKGKGIENPNSGRKGDMYIIVNVVVPTKLDRNQKELIKQLSETDLENSSEFKTIKKYMD